MFPVPTLPARLLADVRDPDLAFFNRFDAGDEALLQFYPERSDGR